MRYRAVAAIAGFMLAALFGGCTSSPSGHQAVTYAVYKFTCCVANDIQQKWHPGQKVQLHWIVESAGQTSNSTPDPIALVAVLEGPFPDAVTLKSGAAAARIVPAEATFTDDRSPAAPISSFELPPDLPAGLYNLVLMVESPNGNSTRAASIVSVGP